jgi:hypothetical protein
MRDKPMNIGLWRRVEELPNEIKVMVKDIGDDCFDCIKQLTKENLCQPIENPIEFYDQYENKAEEIKHLENLVFWGILKAWLKEIAVAAGAIITENYYGTSEVAEQACAKYETAKKWASKNGVKKSTFGKKTVYQWTEEDIDRFIER